jgi:hypothetical protein
MSEPKWRVYEDPDGRLIERAVPLMNLSMLDSGHIKGLLEHAGQLWVVTGRTSMGQHNLGVSLLGLAPAAEYLGPTYLDPKRTGTFAAGHLYTGRVITHRGRSYVMTDARLEVKMPQAAQAEIRAAIVADTEQRRIACWRPPLNKYLHELNGPGPHVGALVVERGRVVSTDGVVYRQPVPGELEVPDLVRPGDVIQTSYKSGGRVTAVVASTVCACAGGMRPHDQTSDCHPLRCWSINYIEKDRDRGPDIRHHPSATCYINELVAVGGRLLKLFEANPDEVFVVARDGQAGAAPEPPAARAQAQLVFDL